MDKRALVDQLASRIRAAAAVAQRAGEDAALAARDAATPNEKREDSRVALEYQSLARGQSRRADQARAELAALDAFRPPALGRGAHITLGAVVEVEDGDEGRTFFLAPVGAGVELTGPGGDGFLSVVSPSSPVGRAVLGKRAGDEIEVDVNGETRTWRITEIC
jgi:transcription elongation GreA/GreB family factor